MDGPKILLVDDDFEFIRSLQTKMTKQNCDVQSCLSGIEALDLMSRSSFDVAVVDLRMPWMDGMTLLGKIKELYPATEVILLTSYASVETGIEGTKKGAFDYLVKPTGVDILLARISAAYEKKTAHHELVKD